MKRDDVVNVVALSDYVLKRRAGYRMLLDNSIAMSHKFNDIISGQLHLNLTDDKGKEVK